MIKRLKKTKPALWTLAFPQKRTSTKRKKGIGQYLRRAREWKKGRMCAYHCGHPASDVHHSRGKAGRLLNDERFWIPLCRAHHDYIHQNPDTSREIKVCVDGKWLPLMCARGDWNKIPKD